MSLSVVSITLNIRNNRTYPQRINVLGSPVNPLDTANALIEYRWDITAYVPTSSDTLTLEYKPLGASVFSIFTYELSNATSEAIISALDSLGIGYFNFYIELGQTYISTFNDDYVFNTLTINSNVTPPTPTTSTTSTSTTAAPTTTTTTTAAPTTSTTTTTTTAAPTTSTTSTTTTAAPTTTTTTTAAPTTSTTSTSTTAAPTSTTTTTAAPTTTTTTTAAPTTSTTSTSTTAAPTSTTTTTAAPTTTTTTTAAPTTTSTTSTSTTAAPTTTTTTTAAPTTTSTSTTTTTLFENLIFDSFGGIGGYTISSIDVNGITPTLTSGSNPPFSVGVHGFNTNQIGGTEQLNIVISPFSVNGCITVTDSGSFVQQQDIIASGTYVFAGLIIDNITPVLVAYVDGACVVPTTTTTTSTTTSTTTTP